MGKVERAVRRAERACVRVAGERDPSAAARAAEEWARGGTSFYDDPQYVWNTLDCFTLWTKRTVAALRKIVERSPSWAPRSLLDAHSGVGLSSAMLSLSFPGVRVFSFTDGAQALVAEELASSFGFTVVREPVPDVDVLCWFESAEHFERPSDVFDSIVGRASSYVDSSSFQVAALGHHEWYHFGGTLVHRSRAKRAFTKHLRALGFRLIAAGWNRRPSLHERNVTCETSGNSVASNSLSTRVASEESVNVLGGP